MLKRPITYEDFDNNTVTEEFYFNISKPELLELDVDYENGLEGWLKQIMESKDPKNILDMFKKIILLAYGERSENGKRFIKSDQLREEFTQTAAYPVLYMELATDAEAAAMFLIGALPKDLSENMNVAELLKAINEENASDTTPEAETEPTTT